MSDDSKKLILGMVSKLSLEQVKPFFWSLEKTGYRGDVCMIVGELGVATHSFLRARQIQLVPFQKAFLRGYSAWAAKLPRKVLSSRRTPLFNKYIGPAYMHPRCARYFFYQLYLQECGGSYNQVMLSDVHDVFFQAHPFTDIELDGLSVFLEGPTSGLANAVKPGPASQATTGVIMGTKPAMRDHLIGITNLLCKNYKGRLVDKDMHNALVSQDPPPKLRCFGNSSGPVINLAGLSISEIQINSQNQVVSSTGNAINIVHQYNRHPELAQKLLMGVS